MSTLLAVAATLLALGSADATTPARTDTTLAVARGDRLDVWNQTGDVVVRSWDRGTVQIVARHGARALVKVERGVGRVSVSTSATAGEADSVRIEVTVPAWLPVTVQGSGTRISAEGALEDLTLKSQTGDISVRGPAGSVKISTAGGAVLVDGARRRVQIGAGKKPVRVSRVAGLLSVAGVANDITLDHIESSVVDVRTVSGKVVFDGALAASGSYHLASQRGDVTAILPATSDATVSVATYVGRFVTDFPGAARTPTPKQRFSIVLGRGGPRVSLEAFAGTVTLRRGS